MKEYQKERVELIKEILPLLGDNYILKGGTALSLYYNLDRYSDDIDLDSISGYMNITNHLSKHKDFSKWKVLHKKSTQTVSRFMIDYSANYENGSYPLKIEISSRNKNLLSNNLLNFQNINGVNVYTIDTLIRQKIAAFNNRDKIRDFYDIVFLLNNYEEKFSNEQILTFYEKANYKDLDDLALLLKDEIITHNLINDDIDTDELVLNALHNCENILKNRKEKTLDNI